MCAPLRCPENERGARAIAQGCLGRRAERNAGTGAPCQERVGDNRHCTEDTSHFHDHARPME